MKLVYNRDSIDGSGSVNNFVDGLSAHRQKHDHIYGMTTDVAVHDYFTAMVWGSQTPMFFEVLRDTLTQHVAGLTDGKSYRDVGRAKAYFGTIRECMRLGKFLHREDLEIAENACARLSKN